MCQKCCYSCFKNDDKLALDSNSATYRAKCITFKFAVQSKADHPRIRLFSYIRLTFLLLWPWPWPMALIFSTRTAYVKWNFLVTEFKVRARTEHTDTIFALWPWPWYSQHVPAYVKWSFLVTEFKSQSSNRTHRHNFCPVTLTLIRWPWYRNLIWCCTCVSKTKFLGQWCQKLEHEQDRHLEFQTH